MRNCPLCNKEITNRTVINGKIINTQRRKYCFECSPFGSGNNQLAKGNKTPQEVTEVLKQRQRKKNKDQYARYQKQRRLDRKSELIQAFGARCVRCGYDRCLWALEFHHTKKEDKNFSLSQLGYTCSWDRLVEEASKCELLCSNCHREQEFNEHHGAVAHR